MVGRSFHSLHRSCHSINIVVDEDLRILDLRRGIEVCFLSGWFAHLKSQTGMAVTLWLHVAQKEVAERILGYAQSLPQGAGEDEGRAVPVVVLQSP